MHAVRRILLAGPFRPLGVHRGGGVVWIVLHVAVRLVGRVLAVLGVGRTRGCRDGWIYRHIGVRLELLLLRMIIVLGILQRH